MAMAEPRSAMGAACWGKARADRDEQRRRYPEDHDGEDAAEGDRNRRRLACRRGPPTRERGREDRRGKHAVRRRRSDSAVGMANGKRGE